MGTGAGKNLVVGVPLNPRVELADRESKKVGGGEVIMNPKCVANTVLQEKLYLHAWPSCAAASRHECGMDVACSRWHR